MQENMSAVVAAAIMYTGDVIPTPWFA